MIEDSPTKRKSAGKTLVHIYSSVEIKIRLFRKLFSGREDVFARRWYSNTTGKSGYQPVCENEWADRICDKKAFKCSVCPNRKLLPLSNKAVYNHLAGKDKYVRDVIGICPMLPDDTCRFLCADFDEAEFEKDVLNGQEPIYHINRSIAETTEIFDDGAHIIYVNASYQNVETTLGRLIHDFMCSQSSDMLCEPIAKVTYKYKNTPEGVDYMCKAVEEYGLKREKEGILKGRQEGHQEGIIDSVIKFIKKGKLSYEEIADNFDMPVDEVRKLAAQTL